MKKNNQHFNLAVILITVPILCSAAISEKKMEAIHIQVYKQSSPWVQEARDHLEKRTGKATVEEVGEYFEKNFTFSEETKRTMDPAVLKLLEIYKANLHRSTQVTVADGFR